MKIELKHRVTITRTTVRAMTFTVKAEDEDSAIVEALEEAYNHEWGTGEADYEVDLVGVGD
jgi:hypothetical protein